MLPAGLKKQLLPVAQEGFVVNRGFEQHCVLYPVQEWELITTEINKLNQYIKQNRDFVRYFYRGATEITMDGNGRLHLPRRIMEYAGIEKELVLFAYLNKIEVWAKEKYDGLISSEPDDFSRLAEDVMGKILNKDDHDIEQPDIP